MLLSPDISGLGGGGKGGRAVGLMPVHYPAVARVESIYNMCQS